MKASTINDPTSNTFTLDILQPSNSVESYLEELKRVALILSYPLVIRPSIHSSEGLIKILHNPAELLEYLESVKALNFKT